MVTRPRLLIVDDEVDIASILKRGLTVQGYSVKAFNLPSDALASEVAGYDHAILDIRMPEMTGFELARQLWRRKKDLQVCFLSAFEIIASEARIAMPKLNSHCFLTKPILPSELAKHIQEQHNARIIETSHNVMQEQLT